MIDYRNVLGKREVLFRETSGDIIAGA